MSTKAKPGSIAIPGPGSTIPLAGYNKTFSTAIPIISSGSGNNSAANLQAFGDSVARASKHIR